jgi:PadR family transcriptional regulator, regulatory protein AphA
MTRATFPETTYAVLGLVDKVPGSSGYDLVAIADRSFAHFWPISQTLLYRELNRLAELGWVTAQRIDEGRSPTKWIYQTTPSGQAVLVEWLAKPAERISTFRSGFLLRFFFAHRMPPERVSSLLTDYRAELTARRLRSTRGQACASVRAGRPDRPARSATRAPHRGCPAAVDR